MNKQTAVDWYFDKIKSHFEHDGDLYEVACMTYELAKEREKEQMEQADINGYDRKQYQHDTQYGGAEYWDVEPKDFEQYYNETYGGTNE